MNRPSLHDHRKMRNSFLQIQAIFAQISAYWTNELLIIHSFVTIMGYLKHAKPLIWAGRSLFPSSSHYCNISYRGAAKTKWKYGNSTNFKYQSVQLHTECHLIAVIKNYKFENKEISVINKGFYLISAILGYISCWPLSSLTVKEDCIKS